MKQNSTELGWTDRSDADLLCAVARREEQAVRELHRRYAPHLYALARHVRSVDAEREVQNAFVAIVDNAHCHARTTVEARMWIVGTAHRVLTSGVARTVKLDSSPGSSPVNSSAKH